MIYLNHKDFEKIAITMPQFVRNILRLGRKGVKSDLVEDRVKSKGKSEGYEYVEGDEDKRKKADITKLSADPTSPKYHKTPLQTARKSTDTDQSHSLLMAIKRMKVPKKVLTEVRKSTEPTYAGGNTAENMRGVIRTDPMEKEFRAGLRNT